MGVLDNQKNRKNISGLDNLLPIKYSREKLITTRKGIEK